MADKDKVTESPLQKWRRRAPRPPPRLEWPAGGPAPSNQTSKTATMKKPACTRKRPRSLVSVESASSSSLWVDKYAPVQLSDLCVAPKKCREVKTWIENKQEKLLILVGAPGVGKSTMVKVIAKELKLEVREWSDAYVSRMERPVEGILSVDQPPPIHSFREFLEQTGVGFQSLTLSTAPNAKPSFAGSIILLDELPNLHNAQAESEFRDIFANHLSQSQVPTILIFSNVSEGKHRPCDLERLLDPSILYAPYVRIMQIQPVTKAKMKKIMEAIARKEGVRVGPSFWDEVHHESGGDLRHAIMTLQFQNSGRAKKIQRSGSYERDVKLSSFHALGKLLYAKRKKVDDDGKIALSETNYRPPLEFEPEEVMQYSDMDHEATLAFLGANSVDFFTEIEELSEAFDCFSDAAMFVDRSMNRKHQVDSAFPDGYVASLAGRAVANANRHPAPNKFRQFSAPKVFEVFKGRRENKDSVERLNKRISLGTDHLSLDSAFGSIRTFVMDHLPFLNMIVPEDVQATMSNLYSTIQPKVRELTNRPDEEKAPFALQQQEQILLEDDILEFESDEEDNEQPQLPGKTEFRAAFGRATNGPSSSVSPTSTVENPAENGSRGTM